MTNLSVATASYSRLLGQVKKEIAEGLIRSQRAYDRERIVTYWKVGRIISNYLLKSGDRADCYGEKLCSQLSEDLSIGKRLLYQMSQFYNAYPNFKPAKNLKWSHYRLLISVRDGRQRSLLESKASSDNWSKRTLEGCLNESRTLRPFDRAQGGRKNASSSTGSLLTKGQKLSIPKGRLYTYRVFKDECAENFLIDCGFNIYRETDKNQIENLKSKFIETVKTGNTFNEYKTLKSNANEKHLYTFKAYPKKIIDGDTLWVMIDCGFKTWVKQKIRLRGIDTPEIETPKGKAALSFVTKALKGLPFIVIKCHKRDKYDRYLSDVFYLRGEQDPALVFKNGNFINQELLDNGLAQQLV